MELLIAYIFKKVLILLNRTFYAEILHSNFTINYILYFKAMLCDVAEL